MRVEDWILGVFVTKKNCTFWLTGVAYGVQKVQGECVLGLMRVFRGSDVLQFAEDLSGLTQ